MGVVGGRVAVLLEPESTCAVVGDHCGKRRTHMSGLDQLRFPEGNIGTTFEEVRRVLEREGII